MTLTFPLTLFYHLNLNWARWFFSLESLLMMLFCIFCYTFLLHQILASSSDDLKWKACQTWKLHFKLTEDFALRSRHFWRFFSTHRHRLFFPYSNFTSPPMLLSAIKSQNLLLSSFHRVRHVRWAVIVKRMKKIGKIERKKKSQSIFTITSLTTVTMYINILSHSILSSSHLRKMIEFRERWKHIVLWEYFIFL